MKIAIIGTGISGLVAARELAGEHELTLYEAGSHVGGHTLTSDVRLDGHTFAVDAGFVVYNEVNYPNFVRLLTELGVESQPTSMSFSVRCERSGIEYCGTSLDTVFAQRGNLLRPSFLRMLADIVRFNRAARRRLASGSSGGTLAEFLGDRYSAAFVDRYLVPMVAAIWSTDPSSMLETPTDFLLSFLDNHGLLTTDGQHQWRVIKGGSRRYVEKLVESFRDRILLRTPVRRVRRGAGAVLVDAAGEEARHYDRVLFATHSDQALELLDQPTALERQVLGAIPYQRNEALLHTDASVLPRSRRAWASWNYSVPKVVSESVVVTYNMSILQGLDVDPPLCVSLNLGESVRPERVLRRFSFQHPLFTPEAVAAQSRWSEISGADRVHFCGAYWGNGFHEAGVVSGLRVARQLGAIRRPRSVEA